MRQRGEFRFDILWNATNTKTNKSIKVFIDTKNYASASNMFSDLGQFKAYLKQISDFNEMYFIQQGGRGVEIENIINRLKNAIEADIDDVLILYGKIRN